MSGTKINCKDVTGEQAPHQHGDDPDQCMGSRDVAVIYVFPPTLVDGVVTASLQEDVADTQPPAQEPEQRCDEARNSVDELIASIFEDSADTQARDPQLSGDPPDSDDASPPKWKTLVKIQHLSLIVMIHNSVDE